MPPMSYADVLLQVKQTCFTVRNFPYLQWFVTCKNAYCNMYKRVHLLPMALQLSLTPESD